MIQRILGSMLGLVVVGASAVSHGAETAEKFNYKADRFADVEVLRYPIPGFDELTLQQKKLAYYLSEAGHSGRDIFWDQRYRYNLTIRKTLEAILESYAGERSGAEWDAFVVYAKRVFFANGIHHHYASTKILPGFSKAYFAQLLQGTKTDKLPLGRLSLGAFIQAVEPKVFDPSVDGKTVDLAPNVDNIVASANNFYRGVTKAEVEAFYEDLAKRSPNPRVMFGLNSQLVKEDGKIFERPWKVGGLYGEAIERIVFWLEKARGVAESELQRESLGHLINFYRTGNIDDFDQHCIAWVKDTTSRIDAVNGFIEVYADAVGRRGAFESVVSMRDEEATKRIAAISAQAQWFEDHSPIQAAHKKKEVKGISAKVITVISESGDSAPSTPVGINLPNAEWIRETTGSKSVSLGNISDAYAEVQSKSPATQEFAYDEVVAARIKTWGGLSAALHTDMHEVIGHASGQLNPGVAEPSTTLKNYASALEEARADLVALYFIHDQKLVDMGVSPSLDVGKAEYDGYITNGLLRQLYRIEPGHQIEEAHMRNRQLVAGWAYEKGRAENVIERVTRDGKTFFRINNYDKLRVLFGQLLAEIQRIKSEGDFFAGQALIENYGVKVDAALHAEVLARYAKLNLAPYSGFIQPKLVPIEKDGEIVDVKVEYPTDFLGQMLEYGRDYGYLPAETL